MATAPAEFGAATREWFAAAFAAPTPAQDGAWRAIAAGRHALVVAPTGSGKTLAAFLASLDRLAREPRPDEPKQRCRVLYISPLKALAVDVERNLRAPLTGIRHAASRLGLPPPDITVGMRTGDTPADERRGFARTPPDILITTPESLFLLLTSAARESLRGVETVIIDEVHAVAATKRGAHLALSLERLDALLPRPAQRIGLSATVRPIEEVARFLGGAAPVEVVQPPSTKTIEVSVQVPVEDMTALGDDFGSGPEPDGGPPDPGRSRPSIWPAVEERVYQLITEHRSTIVFTNSRRGAERLCARLNELAEEHAVPGEGGAPGPGPAAPGRTGEGTGSFAAGKVAGMPAEIMAQSGQSHGAPTIIARAHHGSVSRTERKQIEEALKSGDLPAVVATSSLELGIDMGAVDLVVQIEAPPTVAAGLQRVGRAGHQVGAVSRGVVFPKHRGDLLSCAVVAERMTAGAIEEMRYPRNPLDVLAQQIVAMVSMDPWTVADLSELLHRAAPFAELPPSALHATLDMLSGRYPSTAFAELRPRLVWDRTGDVLTGRPGAQRLAVTSGGTIPDRGLFGVFLAGGAPGARVGELDEEMVYESRVGDVFLLGSSSWRIEDITPDRVLVSPAPGQAARMPFWKGDSPGRPIELGRAIGARLRALVKAGDEAATEALRADGLDDWAAGNLVTYLREQRDAVRALPDDRTVVVERFRDELGDWRMAVHCVLGAKVNAPWALAIGRRLTERYGVDAQVVPSDDGIVVRLPDTMDTPPGADLIVFEPDELTQLVEESVGTSALFASRFRECAARALLLPRRDPRRRQPLWQQRQRAAQLLDVAREYADFPVTLEAARECLQDVFDLPGLLGLARDLAGRKVRVVEVETPRPSPFARSLLFGYVGAFLYEGDAPLAERRAAALALDATLLGELLGRVDLRELLDPEVVAETEARLQWLTEERQPRDAEDVAELLRLLGDLSPAELALRGAGSSWAASLRDARRAVLVRIAGEERWIGIEDAGRVRDALGVALPVGLPEAFLAPAPDPLGDLVARYARTHGPFSAATCAARFGLGVFVVEQALRRLAAAGRVVTGEFSPVAGGAAGTSEWCDAEVLRLLRRRSLAALRREIEPVPARALATFLPRWQQVGGAARGVEAVAAAIDQLQGVAVPASALERLILPARVADYTAGHLDELCATGEVVWSGAGTLPGNDGWVTLAYADAAPLILPPVDDALPLTPLHRAILAALADGQALFFRSLSDRTFQTLAATTAAATAAPAEPPADGQTARGRVPGSRATSADEPPAEGRAVRGRRGGGSHGAGPAPADGSPAEGRAVRGRRGGGSRGAGPAPADGSPAEGRAVPGDQGAGSRGGGAVSADGLPVEIAAEDRAVPGRPGSGGAFPADAPASLPADTPASAGVESGGDGPAGDADPAVGDAVTTWGSDRPVVSGRRPSGRDLLGGRDAAFRPTAKGGLVDDAEMAAAVWDLVWAGYLTNDTIAPLRALLGSGGAHKTKPVASRGRYRRPGRMAMPSRGGPPTMAGRWSLLPERDPDPTQRAAVTADLLLERHGVVTRGAVAAEGPPGGFSGVYPVLAAMEERGAARRGYFVEGLGAAQFAVPGAVDRLRALADKAEDPSRRSAGGPALILAATDPANPFGAALPWPDRAVDSGDGSAGAAQPARSTGAGEAPAPLPAAGASQAARPAGAGERAGGATGRSRAIAWDGTGTGADDAARQTVGSPGGDPVPGPAGRPGGTGHRAGRKAGALVALVGGELVLYVERGGRTLLSFTEEPDALAAGAKALADAVHSGALGALSVERADGETLRASPLRDALTAAGFRPTPRGLRLRS
ncbi:ATP-dependent Lhr-like helicase [Catenuloplanes nepalensis]|uniref:ATP-dependent Lhr-like helicase n=2 Tax=Catenuloplanes nepalensis TaxID=587533 RepID=A0ABT9N005_9ACTN|nr:DEAD/DEAH box helicase [Catenuloplanes nepalensis]MDP9797034.1 ATP-dependent Lhr-like helicase [Catenuloplanes nepalensis]